MEVIPVFQNEISVSANGTLMTSLVTGYATGYAWFTQRDNLVAAPVGAVLGRLKAGMNRLSLGLADMSVMFSRSFLKKNSFQSSR